MTRIKPRLVTPSTNIAEGTHRAYSSGHTSSDSVRLPTPDEVFDALPDCDGIPLETSRHKDAASLLLAALLPWIVERERMTGRDAYTGGNMFIYYQLEPGGKIKSCGPDVFVALDVDARERTKWVVPQEGRAPDLVIEFLSQTTKSYDKDSKKYIYQDDLQIPEYYWFDVHNQADFCGFALKNGVYEPIQPDDNGRLVSERMGGLQLGLWQGTFNRVPCQWLRWYTAQGDLLLTPEEIQTRRADNEKQRANIEKQRANIEKQRADNEKQRANNEKQRANNEKQRANNEKQRADNEKQRADNEKQRADNEKQRADILARKLQAFGVDASELLDD